jgi:hypothetical protein
MGANTSNIKGIVPLFSLLFLISDILDLKRENEVKDDKGI